MFKKNDESYQIALLYFTFHQKIRFLTLTFFLGPLTWNRPLVQYKRVLLICFPYIKINTDKAHRNVSCDLEEEKNTCKKSTVQNLKSF